MYAYLVMTEGTRAGESFLLRPKGDNTVGRGPDCSIMLVDSLCSRVHAILRKDGPNWQVRDNGSRNGTFVNGQKIDEAMLAEGHEFRVGGTTFNFYQSEQPPTVADAPDFTMTQTVVRDVRMASHEPLALSLPLAAFRDNEQAKDLLLLYQLSIRLLGCYEAGEVIRISLELLREHAGASLVGFLWVDDNGTLQPKLMIPDDGVENVGLSASLTRLVREEGRAVWIANHRDRGATASLEHFADALCAPLIHDGQVLGAIHVYLDSGRFRQSHFEFTISLANIAALALARARRQESVENDLERLKSQQPGFDELIGESPPMKDLKAKIARLSRAAGCVLVRGESGSGKELVARALHKVSPRADRPLLSVNCAAIPEDLMESHLFGHKAGAFTGADRDHVDYFQQADLGTLFLDEIGELTLQGQSKLLRVLEGYSFLPVGSTQEAKVDVRVIAATNQDLQTYVREKRFREDLYYRLSVFELHVPPLRERGNDIELLLNVFLAHFCQQHGRPGLELTPAARGKLLGYHWPGNVRQLRNVLDSAVVLAGGHRIEPGDLALRDSGREELETLRIEDWERKLIREALKRTGDSIPEACKLLGISRATLYRKIEEYGIAR